MTWDKQKQNEYNRRYREEHKEEIRLANKLYREKNQSKIREAQKKYREDNCEILKERREKRKNETREYNKRYYKEHREQEIKRCTEYWKTYKNTPMGRAQGQIQQYKFMDRRNGFGDVIDFNAKWIVDNIYTKQCAHCDESDWHKLGCNRIDNTKGHTVDNVEPCCFHCNCVLNGKESGLKRKGKH